MSVSIVVGAQYGSEGKGKVTLWWARATGADAVVRVGGPNSGHTVYYDGEKHVFQMLSSATVLRDVITILPAGSYIEPSILLEEITREKAYDRVIIDPNAVVISSFDKNIEKDAGLGKEIGSTLSGTGAGVVARVKRISHITLAKDDPRLSRYVTDTKKYMNDLLRKKRNIIIEGTQGYGLSNLHTPYYPYCTSRDTTAAGFLSEAGLSPFDVRYIIMVMRAFPIRVGGNSGPLPQETTWDDIGIRTPSGDIFKEFTTVTKRERRVAYFDTDIVKQAIAANKPNMLVLNHVDYIDWENRGSNELSNNQSSFIRSVESALGQVINYIGNGENTVISRLQHH